MPHEAAREATADDVHLLVKLFSAAAAELADARGADIYLIKEAPVPLPDELRAWIADPEMCVLAGTLDANIVGGAVAEVETLRDGRRLGLIRTLYVDEPGREVGVGEELLNAAVAWCAGRGATAVDSLALPGERLTKNFYEAAGFKARLLTVHHRITGSVVP